MVKKSVSLTEEENEALKALALKLGKKEGAILKEALEKFIEEAQKEMKLEKLLASKGMWKNRNDIPDLRELRKSRDYFADDA